MAKTRHVVHLPIEEARHCRMRLGTITMGELAQVKDSTAGAVVEVYKLLDKQLREIGHARQG